MIIGYTNKNIIYFSQNIFSCYCLTITCDVSQTTFDAPSGSDPVAIDFTGTGKGIAWVNGQSIGRYWPTSIARNDGCTDSCNYRGSYSANKCLKNCGKPSQTL